MSIVVFGGGYWGRNYIRELSDNFDDLACVIETNEARADYVASLFKVPVYSSLPENTEYDGAVLALPPTQIIETALPIVKSGRKVLLEKPIAMSMEEATKLHHYEDKIMTSQIYLYHPIIHELKRLSGQMVLDHIFMRRTNDGPVRPWLDCIWDLAPHDISIMNYFMDSTPESVSTIGLRDWAVIRLSYFVVNAVIYVSWLGSPKVRTIELVPQHPHNDGKRVIFNDDPNETDPPLRSMLHDFLNNSWDGRCSFDSAIDVLRVLESTKRASF